MFDVERLLNLGLPSHVISVWQVFFYIAALLLSLLLKRIRICLLITYLFAYYLAFQIYWEEEIAAGSMARLVVYALSGLAIAVLFVAGLFYEKRVAAQAARVLELTQKSLNQIVSINILDPRGSSPRDWKSAFSLFLLQKPRRPSRSR